MIYHDLPIKNADFPIENADFPARYVSLPEGHPPFPPEDHADDQGSHGLGVLGDARGNWLLNRGCMIYPLVIYIAMENHHF